MMKRYLVSFLISFFIIFGYFVNTAYALPLTTWQNMVSNGTTTLYWFDDDDIFLNQFYELDLNNFAYWQATSTDAWHFQFLYLKAFSTTTPYWNYNITIPTHNEGYHFWLLAENNDDSNFLYYYSGGEFFYTTCEYKKSIILADKTLLLWKCPGIHQNPITKVSIATGFVYGHYAEQIYLLVYTDEDLENLIYDETSMYVYLDNLSNYNASYGQWTPEQGITLPAGTCEDLGTFAGALCKVITYLFIPTTSAINQFSGLKDSISTKPPFGYFTSIKNYLATLSSTTTPAFELTEEIEDISIFNTLRTALIWILWIFFGFWVIKRISRFDF